MPYGTGTYGTKKGRPPAKASKKSSLNTTMKGRSKPKKKK